MYRSILVPFSDWQSERSALTVAISLARRSAARLHIVHVRRGRRSAQALAAEDRALEAAVAWASAELDESVSFRMIANAVAGLSARDVAASLAAYADENEVDLVVMSHRRHSVDRVLFGSVGAHMMQLAGLAYLFVPAGSPDITRNGCRVLVSVNSTTDVDRIAHDAAIIARLTGGRVTLLSVVRPYEPGPAYGRLGLHGAEDATRREKDAEGCLAGLARELRAEGTAVEGVVLFGDTLPLVRRASESPGYDLIAIPADSAADGSQDYRLAAALLKPFDKALLVHTQRVADAHTRTSDRELTCSQPS